MERIEQLLQECSRRAGTEKKREESGGNAGGGMYFELSDLIVRQVDGVELVLRCAEVLDGGDFVRAQLDLAVLQGVRELWALLYKVGRDPHLAGAVGLVHLQARRENPWEGEDGAAHHCPRPRPSPSQRPGPIPCTAPPWSCTASRVPAPAAVCAVPLQHALEGLPLPAFRCMIPPPHHLVIP
jgi:hypothetical protein